MMNYLSAFGVGDELATLKPTYQRDADDIVAIWRYRRDRSTGITGRMRRIRDVYNGDLVLPFDEETEPAVANLIMVGIDQKAMRIASTAPQVWFPPEKPGVQASEKKALERRDAVLAWWDSNKMNQIMRQRARYLVAYGSAPIVIKPNPHKRMPEWDARNPLGCYPSEDLSGEMCPSDMITAYNKTYGWFRRHYPEVASRYHSAEEIDDFSQVVLLEYSDPEQVSVIYAGVDPTWEPGYQTLQWDNNTWGGVAEFLHQTPNRAGRTLGVIPQRITLDRLTGEFDQMIGMYGAQAKLMALQIAAVERDVFPDTYLVGRPGENPKFVKGPYDGRTGMVNVVQGGDVQNLTSPAGYQTEPTIDRLERGTRIAGGIPAEFGGESTQNVRTGRRGDAILSAIIDHPIKEAQEQLACSMEYENHLAIDIAKGWWGNTKTSFYMYSGRKAKSGEYAPNALFDSECRHVVSYPLAGADLNGLVVGMGQRIGLGIMSKQSAAELDPIIEDPELEKDRITSEALEMAMLASVQQAASEGTLSPRVVARIAELVKSDRLELAAAMDKAMAEEAERAQAQQEQAAAPTGMEEMMAAESAEATGGVAGIPTVPESGQSLSNLAGLFQDLRQTNTRSAGNQAMGGGY